MAWPAIIAGLFSALGSSGAAGAAGTAGSAAGIGPTAHGLMGGIGGGPINAPGALFTDIGRGTGVEQAPSGFEGMLDKLKGGFEGTPNVQKVQTDDMSDYASIGKLTALAKAFDSERRKGPDMVRPYNHSYISQILGEG